jgi:antitoxin (DNA-binding transcriptional repressor) of toxin-antitoxin stability system
MKTATLNDLQTRLSTVLEWVRGGEDVVVKGEPVAQPVPLVEKEVDWSKSAVFRRPKGEPVLTQKDLDELFDYMRGPY